MNIIIVGAGKVGFTLAEHLSGEGHDVTVIDQNDEAIRHASDALDVMCVKGNGASPEVLKQAGVAESDFFLAATSLDEVNMLCSLAAKQLGAKYTIARIRDVEYTENLASFQRDLDIDMVINPEYATAIEISQLLRFPNATDVEHFFRGRVELLGNAVQEGDEIIGKSLSEMSRKLKSQPFLFCVAVRKQKVIIPNGSFVPQAGDQLYVVGSPVGIARYYKVIGRPMHKVQSVFIVGGSRIAHYLAEMLLQMRVRVTIVENNEARCRFLSEQLPKALVLHGDGTDPELLASENFLNHDAFVALTGRDEDNLLISLYARQQGIKKVVAKCNRDNYVSIVHAAGLESIVSPKLITVGRILRVVRGQQNRKGSIMLSLHRFSEHGAEAMEFEVKRGVRHLETPLKDVTLKPGVLIAAILHKGAIIIPNGSSRILSGDRVIIISHGQLIQEFNDIYQEESG